MLLLLRHCKRDRQDVHFDSSLNDEGKNDSQHDVILQLENHTIHTIYCSPFIRCLETLQGYCEKHSIDVIVDYRLSEFNIETRKLTSKEIKEFHVKQINEFHIEYPESYESFMKRMIDFSEYCNDTETLVCSHEIVIKQLLENKVGYSYGYHEMGKVYVAFNKLVYIQPILSVIIALVKINSLKAYGINCIKSKAKSSWSFLTTKSMESIGCLKESITNVFQRFRIKFSKPTESEEESSLMRLD